MRHFYLIIQKGATVSHQLTWSHYIQLISLNNLKEIKYYIYITNKQNLSKRELRERIKSNEYERVGYKEEIEKPKVNTFIKNPVIIKIKNIPNKLTEYALHKLILEDMDHFLKELGIGFLYVGHEVKINNNYIDFLLFNTKYNSYIVLEIKIGKVTPNHIGQTLNYMKSVDKYIKEPFHNKTIGVILCKKEDGFILEYCSNYDIFMTTFKLMSEIR